MKGLKGALVFAQSGGPTSVINASAAGVFLEGLKSEQITAVYGAAHGIRGILNEEMYDISKEDENELLLLKNTPSSAMGSVRYKLKDAAVDDTDYKRLLEVFKKYDVRYFFYNGGNDSMDTCNKISKYMAKSGYDINVIGVPKTIDNDLYGTDHCPGFASAAKYIATTIMEINLDAKVYDTPMVCIIEAMGRNAGWLTASAALANAKGLGADLIYLPEVPFSVDKFVKDIQDVCAKNNNKCIAVVSEGIHDENGTLICEKLGEVGAKDSFGHAQLGGVAASLAALIKAKTGFKTRGIELSLMQRCGAHCASGTDIEETFEAGKQAVRAAVAGETDKMVCYARKEGDKYECEYKLLPLELAANTEKTVPLEWITNNGTGISEEFVKYALPLIQGEPNMTKVDGLPRFAKLKKVLVEKR
ncbi:MAG: 6-phosphofructokinase [Clostridia bacterium]|nr:6-phosphofructokinase [Clostridia bacterium]MBQ8427559.1 6-phosphofructokinase [Clostridia bacterium]